MAVVLLRGNPRQGCADVLGDLSDEGLPKGYLFGGWALPLWKLLKIAIYSGFTH